MTNVDKKREEFLRGISNLIEYWDNVVEDKTARERLEGLAFSILSTIDGCSGDVHMLIPATEGDSRKFEGRNNISGCLHEEFYKIHRENEKELINRKSLGE